MHNKGPLFPKGLWDLGAEKTYEIHKITKPSQNGKCTQEGSE